MANEWDAKIKGFLKKTGEDFRRAGNDIKSEAQKLMKEVKDPEGQEKIKAGIKDFGGWAKKTAVEMADIAETGFKKAEGAFRQAGENWKPGATGENPAPAPSVTPPSAPPEMEDAPAPAPPAAAAPPPPAEAPQKTIGKKKSAAAGAAKPKAAAKKTIGKKH